MQPSGMHNSDSSAECDYRIDIIKSSDAFFQLEKEWEILRKNGGSQRIFHSWLWNWMWWKHLAPANSRLCVVICRNRNGDLVGLAPFYLFPYRLFALPYWYQLRFIGTNPYVLTSEYLDILIAPGRDGCQAAELITRTVRDTLKWDSIWLAIAQPDSIVSQFLVPVLKGVLGPCAHSTSFCIDTSGQWKDYLAQRGRKTRKNIRYFARRLLLHQHALFQQANGMLENSQAIEALVAFHRGRWRSRGSLGAFAIPGFSHFLEDLIKESAKRAQLRIWTLSHDNIISAVLVAFVENGSAYAFQMGFDSNHAMDSLGFSLIALCIQACFEDCEIKSLDLLSGGAVFKSLWTKNEITRLTYSGNKKCCRFILFCCMEKTMATAKLVLRSALPLPVLLWAKALLWKLRRTR